MSEDASPTGGHTPNSRDVANDANNSLIDKVRSRVSSIIPFSKWFSPTTSHEDGSRNGGVRRRRNETVLSGEEVEGGGGSQDESDSDEEDTVTLAPPSKKSRLNITEDNSPMSSFQITQTNLANNFLSSTPTTIARRRQLGGLTNTGTRQTFSSETQTSTTEQTRRRVTELRSLGDDDEAGEGDADVLEIIPEHPTRVFQFSQQSSSRRDLNIPTSKPPQRPMRRPSLHTMRGSVPSTSFYGGGSSSFYSGAHEEEDDVRYEANADEADKGADDSDDKILTNGVRTSPHRLLLPDTASESGDSQSSSVQQKAKMASLYQTGAKRFRGSMGSGLNYAAHLQGKKSLFGDKNMPAHLNNSTTSLTSLNRRQSFNASLYGSTSALSDSRLLNIYSPFYKGCTTYGGASAYSQYAQNVRRINPPPILTRPSTSMSTLSSSSNSVAPPIGGENPPAISNTAKRILELMNQFTTPLNDVKKMANNARVPALIAHRQRFTDNDRSMMNRGIRLATPKTPYSRPNEQQQHSQPPAKQLTPPLNELQVPTMSQLLQMKKLQRNTEKIRQITNQTRNRFNPEEEYKLPTAKPDATDSKASGKHVNKIKNKLTNVRGNSRATAVNVEETVEPVSLPDVTLPTMESVPKIDIQIMTPAALSQKSIVAKIAGDKTQKSSSSSSDLKSNSNSGIFSDTRTAISSTIGRAAVQPADKQQSANDSSAKDPAKTLVNGGDFVFSMPIEVASTKQAVKPISNFKFSDPFPVGTGSSSLLFTSTTTSSNFVYQPIDSLSMSKTTSIASPTSSVMSVGVPTVANQLKTTGSVLDAFKTPADQTTSGPLSSSSTSFGAQFKMSSNKWECSECLVRNDDSAEKCVACANPKKPAESAESITPSSSEPKIEIKNSFGSQFKAASDTWECSICMIRNKLDLSKCAACETPKSGGGSCAAPVQSSMSAPSFLASSSVPKLATTVDSGFKSIVAQQSAKWECSACMTRNESARTKCICCEQAKPGAESDTAPQFSFGSSASSKFTFGFAGQKEADLKSGSDESAAKLGPSMSLPSADGGDSKKGFTFGATPVTASNSAPSAVSFSFGFKTDAATSAKDEPDKTSSGPKSSFGAPKSESAETKQPDADEPVDRSLAATPPFKFGTSSAAAFSSSPSLKPTSESPSNTTTATTESSSTSIFKPIGSFAFSNSSAAVEKKPEDVPKPVFAFGATKTSTTETSTAAAPAATVSFGLSNSSTAAATNKDDKVQSDAVKSFSFGPTTAVGGDNKSTEKPTGFAFGSVTTGSAFKSPLLTQKTATTAGGTSSAPTFVFGNTPASASITPTFGAISSNVVTSSNTNPVSTAPSFGNLSQSITSSTVKSFQAPAATLAPPPPPAAASALAPTTFGSSPATVASATAPSLFGSSSFGAAASNPTANKSTGLFSFGANTTGAAVKQTEPAVTAAPIFGNVSSTTSTSFAFGAAAAAAAAANASNPAATKSTANQFVFGTAAPKPTEPVIGSGLFGSAPSASTLPTFGTFTSPTTVQQTQQQQQPPAQAQSVVATPFGQSSTISSPFGGGGNLSSSTPTFGSPAPNSTPVFGSAPAAFGSATAAGAVQPTFGSTAPATGLAFGTPAVNTVFGGSAAKQPLLGSIGGGSGFGSTASSSGGGDDPAAKKLNTGFNFGSTTQNQAQSGFAFGSAPNTNNNNNDNKQPFVFSASSTPTFNFTGNPEANNNTRTSISSTTTTKSTTHVATNAATVGRQMRQITRWLKSSRDENNRTMINKKRVDQQKTVFNNDDKEDNAETSKTIENFASSKDYHPTSSTISKTSSTSSSAISANSIATAINCTTSDNNLPLLQTPPATAATSTGKTESTTRTDKTLNRQKQQLLLLSNSNKKLMRKTLISLRSKKQQQQFVLNRLTQKLSSTSKIATTQRKLYYVNRMQQQTAKSLDTTKNNNNNISKNRFKFLRKDLKSKRTVVVHNDGVDVERHDASKEIVHDNGQKPGTAATPVATASNRLRIKSKLSATHLRATRYKKHNPAKFKYVKRTE